MISSIHDLEAHIGDPRKGLPEDIFLFATRITPMVNVDLLIQNDAGYFLLTWRADGLHPAGWHVPGGIVRHQETLETRLHAVAVSELGVDVIIRSGLLALNEVIHPEWINRGHFISLLYACALCGAPDPGLACISEPFPGSWKWHAEVPADLIPAHGMYAPFLTDPRAKHAGILPPPLGCRSAPG